MSMQDESPGPTLMNRLMRTELSRGSRCRTEPACTPLSDSTARRLSRLKWGSEGFPASVRAFLGAGAV